MKEVQYRYTILLSKVIGVGSQFISQDLSVIPFKPDEMIVRQLGFVEDGTSNTEIVQVKCDFIQSTLAFINSNNELDFGYNIGLKNKFKLDSDIRGNRMFYLQSINDSVLLNTHIDGLFSMLLEFVKYKEI